jgi:hypothetical protein
VGRSRTYGCHGELDQKEEVTVRDNLVPAGFDRTDAPAPAVPARTVPDRNGDNTRLRITP